MRRGDVIWVDSIKPAGILLGTPALAVVVDANEVAFVDPNTCGESHRLNSSWFPGNWHHANMDELTDEQLAVVVAWRLEHG